MCNVFTARVHAIKEHKYENTNCYRPLFTPLNVQHLRGCLRSVYTLFGIEILLNIFRMQNEGKNKKKTC